MVAAFLIRSKLKPDKEFEPIDERITDDRFVILVGAEGGDTREKIETALAGIQNVEIK